MNTNCLVCNHNLTKGIILLTESPQLYDDNFRYLHCQECGRTYLINISSLESKEVDYTIQGIEEDIVQSLSSVLGNLQEEILELTGAECSCGDSCDCETPCEQHDCKH